MFPPLKQNQVGPAPNGARSEQDQGRGGSKGKKCCSAVTRKTTVIIIIIIIANTL